MLWLNPNVLLPCRMADFHRLRKSPSGNRKLDFQNRRATCADIIIFTALSQATGYRYPSRNRKENKNSMETLWPLHPKSSLERKHNVSHTALAAFAAPSTAVRAVYIACVGSVTPRTAALVAPLTWLPSNNAVACTATWTSTQMQLCWGRWTSNFQSCWICCTSYPFVGKGYLSGIYFGNLTSRADASPDCQIWKCTCQNPAFWLAEIWRARNFYFLFPPDYACRTTVIQLSILVALTMTCKLSAIAFHELPHTAVGMNPSNCCSPTAAVRLKTSNRNLCATMTFTTWPSIHWVVSNAV